MSEVLHILASTSELDALIQIRTFAHRSQSKHVCICLEDAQSNLQSLRNWMGENVTLYAPTSPSSWIQAFQLYRLGRTSYHSSEFGMCWDPAKFSLAGLALLSQLKGWNSIITTPSKRELAFPGFVGQKVLKGSDQIYVSSEHLQNQHFRNSIVLSPLVETNLSESCSLNLKSQLNLPEDAQVILSLGQFESYSRLKESIWIMGILEHLHPNIHLILCGTGPQRTILENYRDQMVLRPRVHFLDPWNELTAVLQQSDCLLVPADHSGKDWAVQQAIQLNLPVVASRSDGNQESIVHQENGLIGGPSAGGLARLIHQQIIDPTLFSGHRQTDSNILSEAMWDNWSKLLGQ